MLAVALDSYYSHYFHCSHCSHCYCYWSANVGQFACTLASPVLDLALHLDRSRRRRRRRSHSSFCKLDLLASRPALDRFGPYLGLLLPLLLAPVRLAGHHKRPDAFVRCTLETIARACSPPRQEGAIYFLYPQTYRCPFGLDPPPHCWRRCWPQSCQTRKLVVAPLLAAPPVGSPIESSLGGHSRRNCGPCCCCCCCHQPEAGQHYPLRV